MGTLQIFRELPAANGDLEEFKAAVFLTYRRINRGEEPWKETQ